MDHLNKKNKEIISHLNVDSINDSVTFVKHHLHNESISSTTELEERILAILTNPNEEWKNLRRSHIKDM